MENTNAIYTLIQEYPNIFEELDRQGFVNTPMHEHAKNGDTLIVVELMRLMPSFARKLNPQGFSPTHLALSNGHSQTAIRMVEIDRELVRVKGRDGFTPLHYLAANYHNNDNNIVLLAQFVLACPTSLLDVTSRNQTVLHVAIDQNGDDEVVAGCVRVLLEGYEKLSMSGWDNKHNMFLTWKDDNGNTPLHVATIRSQSQVMEVLMESEMVKLINETNSQGLTAFNICEQLNGNHVIKSMLENNVGRATPSTELYTRNSSEERLKNAAGSGDIGTLYTIIKEDPYVLDRIDAIPFVETPLHISASQGKTQFAMEIVMLKPSFTRKANPDGFTPLHLALRNQKEDMVFQLLDFDKDLVRARGRDGETALHFAAGHENIKLLEHFLRVCPQSIQDVSTKMETALHVAVKNHEFIAFDFLVAKLRKAIYEGSCIMETQIMNKGDSNKDTLLHIAVKTNQPEVVRLLLDCGVQKSPKNSESLTPLDLLQSVTRQNRSPREAIKRMLFSAGASSTLHTPNPTASIDLVTSIVACECQNISYSDYSWSKVSTLDRWTISLNRSRTYMSSDLRNMLLVVMVLIATATYQVALNPPGGLLQDNDNPKINDKNTKSASEHKLAEHKLAGKVIMSTRQFALFEAVNTVTLFSAITLIYYLMPSGYISRAMLLPLYLFFCCYILGIMVISPKSLIGMSFSWYLFMSLTSLFAIGTCGFMVILIKRGLKSIKLLI